MPNIREVPPPVDQPPILAHLVPDDADILSLIPEAQGNKPDLVVRKFGELFQKVTSIKLKRLTNEALSNYQTSDKENRRVVNYVLSKGKPYHRILEFGIYLQSMAYIGETGLYNPTLFPTEYNKAVSETAIPGLHVPEPDVLWLYGREMTPERYQSWKQIREQDPTYATHLMRNWWNNLPDELVMLLQSSKIGFMFKSLQTETAPRWKKHEGKFVVEAQKRKQKEQVYKLAGEQPAEEMQTSYPKSIPENRTDVTEGEREALKPFEEDPDLAEILDSFRPQSNL